ncbi:MAG: helix-turn-helix transcriptional regulator [Enterocloster citroniae]|nr:helix-turn-helix transcriptional regulator [Enterocloster citroniae]
MDKTEKIDISYMGPIFKKYRKDADRTQEEVAETVGITVRFLMALENEERRPSIDILLRLAQTLNIPGDALLHPQLNVEDTETEQFVRMFMRLNDRDKEVIRAAVQKMLDIT